MDEAPRPWHQLFGLSWVDVLQGSPLWVESERDLSHKVQRLDLLLHRPEGAVPLHRLPDGFEELTTYNLVTFKSHQEPLNRVALDELVGHGSNLRKQLDRGAGSPPEDAFRRFAVCVRSPQNLLRDNVLEPTALAGVYHSWHNGSVIRVVVIHELALEEHNALFLLFSLRAEQLEYAAQHYRLRSEQTGTLLLNLVGQHRQEGIEMPESLIAFTQRTLKEILRGLSPEERLAGVPAEELCKRLSPEERLAGLPAEELRKRLSPEERVQGLSADELEALARRLRENGGPASHP